MFCNIFEAQKMTGCIFLFYHFEMEKIILNNPPRLVFGNNSLQQFFADYSTSGHRKLFILTIPALKEKLELPVSSLKSLGIDFKIYDQITSEPGFSDVEEILSIARSFQADSVVGIGGGSVLDTAKLIAAQLYNSQSINDVVGIGRLNERKTWLACLPSTSGTGSEVSPNAIFMDEKDHEKKGIISPYLVPDAAYIDPVLTVGVPPSVTAATGIDAFAHCLEAYVNRFSHPVTDHLAMKGMKLIFKNLKKAFDNGNDLEARANIALGSMYGGMCLGPVNTTAVHALAYPLGSKYKIAHGLSNALILPYVLEFNKPVAVTRYAEIAKELELTVTGSEAEDSALLIQEIKKLIYSLQIPQKLSELGIPGSVLHDLADSAMKVQRLLKNNVRDVSFEDALDMYKKAY